MQHLRTIRVLAAFALSSQLLAGCAAQEGLDMDPGPDALGGKADGSGDSVATLRFTDDFEASLSGTVRAGAPLRVLYDTDRLPQCRSEQGGIPQWGISGHATVDGGEPTLLDFEVTERDDVLEATIERVPSGADLALYFSVSDRYGCIEYDSDYGNDYHFDITAPEGGATVRFEADGGVHIDGVLRRGGTITVHYEPARHTECRGTTRGNVAWSVTGYLSVDGGEPVTFSPTEVVGTDREARDVEVALPYGDRAEMWFEHTNVWGCQSFDSSYGANYAFDLE